MVCVAASSAAAQGRAWKPPTTLDRRGLTFLVGKQGIDTTGPGDLGGWLLGGPGGAVSTRFGVGEFQVHGRHYVTLDSMVTDGAKPLWKVLDAVWVPIVSKPLVFSRGCAHAAQLQAGDMNPDGAIMGIAVFEDAEFFSKVLFAWRADTTSQRFQILSPVDLRCYNDAFGVD